MHDEFRAVDFGDADVSWLRTHFGGDSLSDLFSDTVSDGQELQRLSERLGRELSQVRRRRELLAPEVAAGEGERADLTAEYQKALAQATAEESTHASLATELQTHVQRLEQKSTQLDELDAEIETLTERLSITLLVRVARTFVTERAGLAFLLDDARRDEFADAVQSHATVFDVDTTAFESLLASRAPIRHYQPPSEVIPTGDVDGIAVLADAAVTPRRDGEWSDFWVDVDLSRRD